MKLYLIKRISDGKFFVSTDGNGREYFAEKPAMFLKTPDGVASNLRRLCSEYYKWFPDGKRTFVWYKAWRNFNPEKLTDFEIVVMDVDIISMTATPAADFVQPEAIESAKVSRFESKCAA